MEDCKYRLPCGRCKKLGAPCDAPKECEHDWETVNFEMTNNDLIFHCVCRKCNEVKVSPMSYFLDKINDITGVTKECKHDWHINGQLHGKEARYTMHTCSKCGKEETLKTYINEDGRWTTHSV